LTNPELDKVLADFRAISAADDVAYQLQQLSQPAKRMLYATAELLDQIGLPKDSDDRERYLAGVRNKDLMDTDETDLQRAIIACSHTAKHKQGIPHNHPRTHAGTKAANAHQVGGRKKPTHTQGDLFRRPVTENPIPSTQNQTHENPL